MRAVLRTSSPPSKLDASAAESGCQGPRKGAPQAAARMHEAEAGRDLLDSQPDGGVDVHGRGQALEADAAGDRDRELVGQLSGGWRYDRSPEDLARRCRDHL